MRGKAAARKAPQEKIGITPAHAGKSVCMDFQMYLVQDHPRACGEKFSECNRDVQDWGSPPRMRGKDGLSWRCAWPPGITPAHAGKSL